MSMKRMGTGAEDIIRIIAQRYHITPEEGDYPVDGLLYCGKCNTPRQMRLEIPTRDENYKKTMVVSVICDCRRAKSDAQRKRRAKEEKRLIAETRREKGIQDRFLCNCRFENAEMNDILIRCQNYVTHWEQMKANNAGILFYGNTGTGKTYAAACIANALIDRGVPAMITSFPRILSISFEERQEFIANLRNYQLLVIDDLGVEWGSDFAGGIVNLVIDEWYKINRPLIVTTNLTPSEFKNPDSLRKQRIYERILEMCAPVAVVGVSRRTARAIQKRDCVHEIFGRK